MHKVLKTGIVGASGYSGGELLKILFRHPNVKVSTVIAHSQAGRKVEDVFPEFRDRTDLVFQTYSLTALQDVDFVFIALPSGSGFDIIKELVYANKRVIDIGSDFRFEVKEWKKYFEYEHTARDLIKKFVYGLTELNREKIETAKWVANPGCYPTSVILPLVPFLKADVLNLETSLFVSSVSGISGAGRQEKLAYSFVELNENVRAYKVGHHQHKPEIESALKLFTNKDCKVNFVPHLIPITRGIYSTIQVALKMEITASDALNIIQTAYRRDPFIRILNQMNSSTLPSLRAVQYTNFIDMAFSIDNETKTLTLLSAMDNLVKGAAGQAIQNFNLMNNFNETAGL